MLLKVKKDKIGQGWGYTLKGKLVIGTSEMVDTQDYHIARGTDTLVEEKQVKIFLPFLKKEIVEACNSYRYSLTAYIGKTREKKTFLEMKKFNGITTITSQDKILVQFNELLEFRGEYEDFFRELFKRDKLVTTKQKTAYVINNLNEGQKDTFHKCTEILLNQFTDIVFNTTRIEVALTLLVYTAKAHNNIARALNLSIYPKLNTLVIRDKPNGVKTHLKGEYHNQGVNIYESDNNDYGIMLTYYHEMGHFIHGNLTVKTNPNFQHNKQVFHQLITELRRTDTVKYLREKAKLLPTHKNYFKYLLKENEIIARIFATFLLYKYHKGEAWFEKESKDTLRFFEESDIQIFIKHMKTMK